MSARSLTRLSPRRATRAGVLTGIALLVALVAGTGSIVPASAGLTAALASGTQAAAPSAAPSMLYSTYLGGSLWDEATDVEADARGNTYVAGFTLSANIPGRTAGRRGFHGLADAFVVKLTPDGRSIAWRSFLGGTDVDVANSLALDRSGNVYVVGVTGSADFPTTTGAAQPTIRGGACQSEPCHDAFVTKLSPAGQILYSTFLGGSANEEAVGVAVDGQGSAYVTGNTDSADFPTRQAVQSRSRSAGCRGDLPCPYDVFVSKLNPGGSSILYSTYLSGTATDTSGGIAVDAVGSAYVTGSTRSTDFPTARALRPSIRGRACGPPPAKPCLDAFVSKLSTSGSRLVYSTFLGGMKNERGNGIAVDGRGAAVVTGSTQSADFPTKRPVRRALDNRSCTQAQPEEQCDDGFVTKLAPTGASLVFSTFLGGQAEDQGLAVTVDQFANVYVGGRTDSRNFPVRNAVQPRFGGYIDGFATSFSAGGTLRWSTFVGGSKADRVEGVSVDPRQGVRLAGRTLSTDFPRRRPLQPTLRGEDYDAFVTALR